MKIADRYKDWGEFKEVMTKKEDGNAYDEMLVVPNPELTRILNLIEEKVKLPKGWGRDNGRG